MKWENCYNSAFDRLIINYFICFTKNVCCQLDMGVSGVLWWLCILIARRGCIICLNPQEVFLIPPFTQNINLRTHTNEKPYPCNKCPDFLYKIAIWRYICENIQERNHILAINIQRTSELIAIWKHIWEHTQVRNHILAINVQMLSQKMEVWRNI